jgi:methanethiol S-methyltransferase
MATLKNIGKTAAAYGFAGLTTVIGIASFIVFGRFLMATKLDLVRFGMSAPVALAWDALLCLIFFVQHSGMVRRSFHNWVERWIPGYLHGTLYTFSSAAALVFLSVMWQPVDEAPVVLGGAVRGIMSTFSRIAILCFVWAFASLESLDAFGTGAVLARFRGRTTAPSRLTVKGPYRWVRHPFYFLAIVLLWTTPVISIDRVLLNALFTVWIVLGARWEERDLAVTFGEDYRRHQRQVPMLIPWKWQTK